jgi:hypothetical protein
MYKIRFFKFLEPFFAHLTSKFLKNANMTFKIFFTKVKEILKKAEFHANFKSVEKVPKKCTKKLKVKLFPDVTCKNY